MRGFLHNFSEGDWTNSCFTILGSGGSISNPTYSSVIVPANATGNLKPTYSFGLPSNYASGNYISLGLKTPWASQSGFGWEEFIVEGWLYIPGDEFFIGFYTGSNILFYIGFYNDNSIKIRESTSAPYASLAGGTTLDSASGAFINNQWFFVSIHVVIDSSTGRLAVHINNTTTAKLVYTGNTEFDSDTNVESMIFYSDPIASANATHAATFFERPRCCLVTVSSGTVTTGTITGGTSGATADVYAFESATEDPRLSAGQYRLFLKNVSFLPSDNPASGFSDGESITGAGIVTGVLDAPNAHYLGGLEPGGMFIYPKYGISCQLSGDGALATGFTASGGGNRYEDVDELPPNTTAYLTSSSDADIYSAATQNLTNQSEILDVHAVCISAVALRDGTSPNALALGERYSATNVIGPPQVLQTSYNIITEMFADDTSGAQWTKSNLDSFEALIESSTE